LIVTKYIFDRYTGEDEGFMTRIRTKLVCGEALSAWALKLGLQKFLMMNSKALQRQWNLNPSKLEDASEALVGALFEDCGISACRNFIYNLLKRVDFVEVERDTNWKESLMRHLQGMYANMCSNNIGQDMFTPMYAVEDFGGDGNDVKQFRVSVSIGGRVFGRGIDRKKKAAEQMAAHLALVQITESGRLPLYSNKSTLRIPNLGMGHPNVTLTCAP
jgi:ribonuclease-3